MARYRKNMINSAFAEECARIMGDVKDPRVSGAFISIVSADVSADLKYAKVYYSVLGDCDDRELGRGLKSATPYFRSRIAASLNLRVTPEISFVKDEGIRHGAEIAAILKQRGADARQDTDAQSESGAQPGTEDAPED